MEPKNTIWLLALALLLALTGCYPCLARRLESPNDLYGTHGISPRLIRDYGCSSFRDVTTANELIDWCVAHREGDTVALNTEVGCRVGETPGGCERYWACEGPTMTADR